jgi:hypothetical protein
MSLVQRFTQVFGALFALVGVAGFIPPLLVGTLPGVMGPLAGLLLGLFAVNWFHSAAHLLFGALGLLIYRNYSLSKIYALGFGVAYVVLFLLGVFSGSVGTLGGLLPLNSIDDVLHIVTALIALGAYFSALQAERRGAAQPRA